MKVIKCEKCEREITVCNYKKHLNSCKKRESKLSFYKQVSGKYKCPHCDNLYSKFGINGHVWRSHTKEGEEFTQKRKQLSTWSKGLTKKNNEVLLKRSIKAKEGYKNGTYKLPLNKNSITTNKKRSETVRRKVKEGTWHYSFSKTRIHEYKGVKLHGKWELQYAKWLDNNNIKWRRPNEKFVYIFENKERFYTPDFYLIETNEYVEIKGYETEKDRSKWRDFPLKLKVIKGKGLFEMGIITDMQFKGLE